MTESKNSEEAQEIVESFDSMVPRWVEFSRLGNVKEIDEAARKFFGDATATNNNFKREFGVDLLDFKGYYIETGLATAPEGPFTPTRITPILVLRQSCSGKSFTPHLFKHDGILHESRRLAWIKLEEWDKHTDDTFGEELNAKAQEERAKAEKIREGQQQIKQLVTVENNGEE